MWLLLLLFPLLAYSQDIKSYIPPQANQYFCTISNEVKTNFTEFKFPYYFGGLIEHESCISLKHKRCWSPTSELNTKREYSIGLGQLAKAFNEDGTVRFDSLTDLRNRYKKELHDLSWETIKTRPDLQIRAIVLMTKNNYNNLFYITNEFERLAMSDAAYNGGLGGLQKDRRACSLAKGCDVQKWFNNVDRYCMKNKKILYGNRSACDINRFHVTDVLNTRMVKYKSHF
jgi:hypothetical protein